MIVFIDAYNVLRFYGAGAVSNRALRAFCDRVRTRCELKQYCAFIVCDGGTGTRPSVERMGTVQLWYAGGGKTADECISVLCDRYAGHECVVISADRELRARVRSKHGLCVDPQDFWAILHAKEDANVRGLPWGKGVRRYGDVPSAMDALLQEVAGGGMQYKQEEERADRSSPADRLSRVEKRYKALLEKL